MAGIRQSESTVERATQDVGRRLAEMLGQDQTVGLAVQWQWHLDASGRKVAYFTIDANGTRQQGPGNRGPHGLRRVGVQPRPAGIAPAPRKRPPEMPARYVAGIYSLDRMGLLLRRQAPRVGMEDAEVWGPRPTGATGWKSSAGRTSTGRIWS